MKYFSKIIIAVLLLLLGCSDDEESEARKLIDYFINNTEQLEQFKLLQIVPQGEDVFVYGIDSLDLSLYLVDFDIDNPSSLRISYLPDSLLLERGISDKENFKTSILKSAYKNLFIMKRLKIKAINSCQLKEDCCISCILQNEDVVNYFCSEITGDEQIKKRYSYDTKIVGKNWTYTPKTEN